MQQIPIICALFIPSRKVFKPEGLYLQRWYLTPVWWLRWFRPWFIHHILLDDARTCHSHPGAFDTYILKGEYREHVFFPKQRKRAFVRDCPAGTLLRNPVDHCHYVTITKPVWSLVRGWKAVQVWGFWKLDENDYTKDVFVDWRTYLNLPDAKDWPEDAIRK
jgi:hypothetical protein